MKYTGPILIVCAGLLLSLPVLLFGFPRIADDAVYHVVWYPHFIEQSLAGDLYPRWLMKLNGGFGSPVFFFYPPVPYYLTGLFRPFFSEDPDGWRQLALSASAAVVASGLSAYLWLKDSAGRRRTAAVAGGVVYMAMPYHLAVDLYTRAAFAELWAFAWLPLILYSVRRVASGRGATLSAVVWLSLGYALLVGTHLPTALIFSPVAIAYGCVVAGAARAAKVLATTLAAMTLGAGLAAVYLLPALLTQDFVSMGQMRGGFFHYSNWFLFAKLVSWEGFNGKLGLMALTVIAGAAGAFAYARLGPRGESSREGAFWLATTAASVFMMTPLSGFVWRLVPALQAIQFPYRFNVVLTVAATALAALAVASADPARKWLNRAASAAACSLVAVWVLAAAYGASTAYPRDDPRRQEIFKQMAEDMRLARDAPEYRPRTAASTAEAELNDLLTRVGAPGAGPGGVGVVEGAGRAEVAAWGPRDILLRVDAPADVSLRVSQFYYPLWEAQVVGEPCCLPVAPSDPDGLLTLRVPGGAQPREVRVRLLRGAAERAGLFVSAASCAILLSLPLAGLARRRRSAES